MEESGIVINMKKAIFDRKEVEIAGGIFGREELKEAVKAMEERGKLKEQVRILREALAEVVAYEDDPPPKGTKGAEVYEKARAALEATKEGA